MSPTMALDPTQAMQLERFDAGLERLASATDIARPQLQAELARLAEPLLRDEAGLHGLYERAPGFEENGVFSGTTWEKPSRLQPRLVAGTLLAAGDAGVMEALSDLRMLAVATGRHSRDDATAAEAAEFLEKTLALNLHIVFPRGTEADRIEAGTQRRRAEAVLRFLYEQIPHGELIHLVVEEIEAICSQRPVWTHLVRQMVRMVARVPGAAESDNGRLQLHVEAILGPTPMSRRFREPGAYGEAILEADESHVAKEVAGFAASLRRTGLACDRHAVLVRHLALTDLGRVADALGLDDRGRAELEAHPELVRGLVETAVHPGTSQALYGLARLLERGVLSQPEVPPGLRRLIDIEVHADLQGLLLATLDREGDAGANEILVAGAVRVLGQPLGVGQGKNPTCQAARGISLWAQHRPGYLLGLLATAARDNAVQVHFEGHLLDTRQLAGGLAPTLDPDLDPVSLVLVPHLDRLYDEMMRRVLGRGQDGHKWVNPGLYGRIVPMGFASAFDAITWHLHAYDDFVRRFYASHHPDYNGSRETIHPNPVGIAVTNARAVYLGLHAVTIQRVAKDPDHVVRVYFYNPNNEGRQDWGQGIVPSVAGHGEEEGESSLPFHQFTSRLYAFHYNPFEEGDAFAVPAEEVAEVRRLVRESWGQAFIWDEPVAGALWPGGAG